MAALTMPAMKPLLNSSNHIVSHTMSPIVRFHQFLASHGKRRYLLKASYTYNSRHQEKCH